MIDQTSRELSETIDSLTILLSRSCVNGIATERMIVVHISHTLRLERKSQSKLTRNVRDWNQERKTYHKQTKVAKTTSKNTVIRSENFRGDVREWIGRSTRSRINRRKSFQMRISGRMRFQRDYLPNKWIKNKNKLDMTIKLTGTIREERPREFDRERQLVSTVGLPCGAWRRMGSRDSRDSALEPAPARKVRRGIYELRIIRKDRKE